MKIWFYLSVSFFAGLIMNSIVYAYVPPSQYIVKTWINKHNYLKRLKLRSTVTSYEKNLPTSVRFKETLFLIEGQKIKSWATDDLGQVLFFQEKPLNVSGPLLKLFFATDLQDLSRTLKEKGIPVQTENELSSLRTEADRMNAEQTTFMRWKGSLAWVIGQKPIQNDSSQLWVEKDSFFPLRAIFLNSPDRDWIDFHFENYRRDFYFPRSLTALKKDGETAFLSQLTDITAEQDFSRLPHLSGNGFTSAGNQASSELRKLIQVYYDNLR